LFMRQGVLDLRIVFVYDRAMQTLLCPVKRYRNFKSIFLQELRKKGLGCCYIEKFKFMNDTIRGLLFLDLHDIGIYLWLFLEDKIYCLFGQGWYISALLFFRIGPCRRSLTPYLFLASLKSDVSHEECGFSTKIYSLVLFVCHLLFRVPTAIFVESLISCDLRRHLNSEAEISLFSMKHFYHYLYIHIDLVIILPLIENQ
jgi:hypothetical protein